MTTSKTAGLVTIMNAIKLTRGRACGAQLLQADQVQKTRFDSTQPHSVLVWHHFFLQRLKFLTQLLGSGTGEAPLVR